MGFPLATFALSNSFRMSWLAVLCALRSDNTGATSADQTEACSGAGFGPDDCIVRRDRLEGLNFRLKAGCRADLPACAPYGGVRP